jgi:outer membrane protein OmpA-like peptidoglycan-associated protein
MKKAIVTLCVIMLTAMSAFAGGGDEATRYNTPKFSQGWFIDLAGTYSIFASTGSAYHKMNTYYGGFNATNPKHLIGFSGKLGRRVSPSVALRAGYDWHPSYNRKGDFTFQSLHFDVMESPLDLFFGYKPDRFYTMWVYGGAGLLAYNPGKDFKFIGWKSNLEFGIHGGIMNNFRISNSLDFHIDLTAVATKWSFDDTKLDHYSLWHRAHFDFSGMAGIMWYLGGRRFDASEGAKVENDCSAQERRIQELSEELARCRANASNTGNVVDPQPCDTIVKFKEGESISYPFSIFFNKGSYELRDGRDRVNLQEFANAAKQNGYKVILRGTCDSATASSAFNKTLAENRCNKVKQELVKLGVPESNITINAVGGVKELTPTEYDRRVLIQLSK